MGVEYTGAKDVITNGLRECKDVIKDIACKGRGINFPIPVQAYNSPIFRAKHHYACGGYKQNERSLNMMAFDDQREIKSLIVAGGVQDDFAGVKIEAYREAGEMGYTLWFKITKNNKLIERVNGKYVVRIIYAED